MERRRTFMAFEASDMFQMPVSGREVGDDTTERL
jgi:hypothetical protein